MSGVSHFVNGSRKAFEAHLLRYQLMTLYLCVFESVTQTQVSVAARQICLTADSLLVGKLVLVAIMSLDRRSRNPMARKIASDRFSYRDDPYRRDSHRTFSSQSNTCKNCKRPGHFARECPNVSICHNCGLPGHNLSECSAKSVCWNCREPGHMSNSCTNEGICHSCGIAGHQAKDCTARHLPPGDLRLCNNCYKQGHFSADCTNEKACNNCRKTGHLARDCRDDPVCNHCNLAGHLAIKCPKTHVLAAEERRPRGIRAQYREEEVVCRNCRQVGHMSRDCTARLMICRNCGGRGHIAYECPSGRLVNHHHYPFRY
ncbi:unnamed protein product [Brassica rapa]|uniref:CCHC-type domain-containing protein n=1 Tax=Brassica campestris TaxID=3711 RepID=A0A3P5Z8T4_BRACM|nr:unnamed protein product [Brassica rapa]VDC69201.1 unnamed protein product [Brassica rapa]